MRMAISRDSTFDSVKFLILIYPSNMFPLRIGRNKCFKIVFNKILSLGEILARLKWVSMIGDPTFPRMYCARNDAAKGGHVMHLYASAVLIHARYVVIIMPAYTRHNEVLHGQSSPLSFSYDIPCPYHTLVHSPFFLFTLHFRIFTDRKKNISIEFDREIDTTNILSSQPILVSSIL